MEIAASTRGDPYAANEKYREQNGDILRRHLPQIERGFGADDGVGTVAPNQGRGQRRQEEPFAEGRRRRRRARARTKRGAYSAGQATRKKDPPAFDVDRPDQKTDGAHRDDDPDRRGAERRHERSSDKERGHAQFGQRQRRRLPR